MDKRLLFNWVSFIGDSEEYAGSYGENKLAISYIHTPIGLSQMVEVTKPVESIKGVKTVVGTDYASVSTHGLTTPIRLVNYLDLGDYLRPYKVLGEAPSLQWFLDHKEEIRNPDPSKLLYVNSMVVKFSPYAGRENGVTITLLDTKGIPEFVDNIEGSYVKWLNGTFEEFIRSYGYLDEDTIRDIACILMVYQAANQLGFKEAKTVIAHFFDKHLVAELGMKGVFAEVKSLR